MSMSPNILSPKPTVPKLFTDAVAAVARIEEIYERNTEFLRGHFEAYARSEPFVARVRATYPFVRITTTTYARLDSRLSYGFVAGPGTHETTVTRPDLFRAYLTEQIGLLIENHGVPVEIGESDEPVPIHFAYRRDINIAAGVSARNQTLSDRPLRDIFDTPELAAMDDAIVNGALHVPPGAPAPLALFRAARIDYSLHRLFHYTGTDPEHFQNFVVFTNYQFYADAFARLCRERMAKGDPGYEAFIEPGNVITRNARLGGAGPTGAAPERSPQMPALHLVAPDCGGITMITSAPAPRMRATSPTTSP
jgi:AMP nucleosidase